MNNLPLEENKEIVAELCREMGKELKAIDDPWYKERILSDMILYQELRVENGELRVMICMIVNHIDYNILNKVIIARLCRLPQQELSTLN